MDKIDIPIRSLQEDEFEILRYAKGLCSFIEKCDTPISISIQGEWGSGKTSLMNIIENELCSKKYNDDKFDSIWINTWELFLEDNPDKAVSKLINMIMNQLETKFATVKKKNSKDNFSSDLKALARNLSKAVLSITGVSEDAQNQLVQNVFNVDNISLKVLKDKFEQLLEEIIKNSNNEVSNRGFIIFIDDLDRIDPKMAITLLEALKNIFDLRFCVFVIAIDYEVVSRGLELKYGNLKFNTRDISKDYFDKMIQLPFVMPVSRYKIDNVIEKRLLEMDYFVSYEEYNFVKDDIISIFGLCTNNNPRTIKRLLNMLHLTVIMDSHNIKQCGTTYKVLELILVSMQLTYPSVYQLLLSNQDFKTWKRSILIDENISNITDEIKERYNIDSEWKEVIYFLASKDYVIRKNYGKVSSLLELFDKYMLRCGKKKEYISDIFGLIGMTNVNTDSDTIFYDGNEYNKSSQTQVKQAGKLIDEIDVSNCNEVLDVGCGSGLTTIQLLMKNPTMHIDAFDYSLTQVKNAIKNYKDIEGTVEGSIDFYELNALDLEEKDKYDLVFSNATLHWITQSMEMYTLLYNSLKDGGKLAVHQGGYNSYCGLHEKVRQAISNLEYNQYFENWKFPVFYPTKNEMENILHNIGFKNINVISYESDGTEFENLIDNFKTASLIFYRSQLESEDQYNKLVEEYLRLCKEQHVNKYSHRLYIFADK